ncbi:MAG: hypothetical protein AVDCRST_MAG91-3343 [uncultured Sphingomonadaceae bacterium]|uniref:Acetolactate synthase n=1 Tax=uncultured Sphingomonadaceae bacterium TaxID=169976 RepID=A0A6J4TYU3_9SPHN|nr:MAG: hypothetical protein AVDCRST_MAG91-3343 [uncultured Sphingomonadaceae bacterium]
MVTRLNIAFAPGEGALVRMLGLVERRGFDVRGVSMADGSMMLDVEARDGSRRLDMLDLQLRRLVDVRDVRVAT